MDDDAPPKPELAECEAGLLGGFVFHAKMAWRDTVALFKDGKLGDGAPFVDEIRKDGKFYEWTTLHPGRRNVEEISGFVSGQRLDYLVRTKQVPKEITYTGTQFELKSRARSKIIDHVKQGGRITDDYLRTEIDPMFLEWRRNSE